MASACYIIKPDNPRGLDTDRLSEVVGGYCSDVTKCESVKDAVDKAQKCWKEMCDKDSNGDIKEKDDAPVIVAWGSLSYIGQIVM
jgi:dihydrofolate synthase/folylpolyglutamate synthase